MSVVKPNVQRWISEMPIFVIGCVLVAASLGLLAYHGVYAGTGAIKTNFQIFSLFVVAIAAIDALAQLVRHRPKRPLSHLGTRYFSTNSLRTIVAGLPLLMVAILLLPFFSKMKAAIPLFNEYTWDDTFIEWDRAIFLGYDAWEVLQPVLGYPIVTATLAVLYHVWMLLLYPGVLFFAFAKIDQHTRRQFFLTYVLSWSMIGGAMATWLASVGPCFVGPMMSDWRFAGQMEYLYAANEQYPIMVLPVQEMLLTWYADAENGLGSGITAMPSMHCAIAFLYWIAVRRVSPRWGVFFAVFFFITWIGSVHLAYHYAVDGLVSLIAVAAIWWLSGKVFSAWDAFLANRAQPALRTNTVPAE